MKKITALETMIAMTDKLNKLYRSKISDDGSCKPSDAPFLERVAALMSKRQKAFCNQQFA